MKMIDSIKSCLGLGDRGRAEPMLELWSQVLPGFSALRLVAYSANSPDGPIPVWSLSPDDKVVRPLVLYAHAHGHRYEVGKSEIIGGRATLQAPPLGIALAQSGYTVVSWDARGFGARRSMVETAWTKSALWRGRSPWGLMIDDALRVLDSAMLLETVDRERIATIGLSMGATKSLWLTALDERIKVCVELCCLAEISGLIATGDHDRHAPYLMVPGWLDIASSLELCRLVAPRAHLVCAGALDPLTPQPSQNVINMAMTATYEKENRLNAWQIKVEDHAGHEETPGHRRALLAFLKGYL